MRRPRTIPRLVRDAMWLSVICSIAGSLAIRHMLIQCVK